LIDFHKNRFFLEIKDGVMPQLLLPLIPTDGLFINDVISVKQNADTWIYSLGVNPFYIHGANDTRSLRMITSMMIESKMCRHSEIIKAFDVSKSVVNRSLKKLRTGGPEAFYQRKEGGRKGTILTPEVLEQAQSLLDQGFDRKATVKALDVSRDAFRKALSDGRLREKSSAPTPCVATSKTTRSAVDATAAEGIGIACTRTTDRVMASLGKLDGANTHFEPCVDVPSGGVLCALPALLVNGLLMGVDDCLGKLKGYYSAFQIMLFLAFMSLCRIKNVDRLKGHAPGEYGKLLGLDRSPEIKCLREKMDALSSGNASEVWAAHLSKYWMESDPESAGTLYVDGHVRVYHGELTSLPRKYVSRQKLCLRGTTDYWVNDAIGRPFFLVEKPIDSGLISALENEIVPKLLLDIPGQPSDEELTSNPLLSRFVLVFDREGYSPEFFKKMWENHRIACITYHKYPKEAWSEDLFEEQSTHMPNGEVVTMKLAEKETLLGTGKQKISVREVRKLTDSGHQTSLISTAYDRDHTKLAASMFSRWCQENFFKYMKQNFEIDRLCEYGVMDFHDTEKVVNPTWREHDKQRSRIQSKLQYRRSQFAKLTMHPESDGNPEKHRKWLKQKSELLEAIEHFEHQLKIEKQTLKATPKHITWEELPDSEKFQRLLPGRKHLKDTIGMIAYRSETAMAGWIKEIDAKTPEVRRLLQNLFVTEADIFPDMENEILIVRVHNASTPAKNRILAALFERLNETKTKYPGTHLVLSYQLVSTGA
jgi:transposase